MSHYLHHVPGRLRVRTRVLKGNEVKAAAVRSLLKDLPGVQSIDLNLLTGSMLIRYDSALGNSAQILGLLVAHGCINLLPETRANSASKGSDPLVLRQIANNLGSALPKILTDVVVDKVVQRATAVLVSAVV